MPKRKYHRQVYQKRGKVFFIFKLLTFIFLFFILSFGFLFIYYAKDLPLPEKFTERQIAQSTKIYDRTGEILLYEIYGEEKRTWVPLAEIPEHLKQAVIAAEDKDFYSHFGIDIKGIIRAILADLRIKAPIYGGSTIPQQLIRSTFLTNQKTVERKIREIILAVELDQSYSKEQILEWYLNQIPFGENAYGVQSACQTYFKKDVSEISLEQSAVLASLIKAPSYLSPYRTHLTELLGRKDYILDRMSILGFISEETAELVKEKDVNFTEKKTFINAPYFTLWVKDQLEEKYGSEFLRQKGLIVQTSLDWEIQKIAEQVVRDGIDWNKVHNAYNAGLVAINPKNGQILAMTVGSGDYYDEPKPAGCISGKTCLFDPKFNVVIGTEESPGRQPGSALKPFVYATAFNQGYDDKTIVVDEETNFGLWGKEDYIPQNYDEKFRGPVTLRQSLAQSLNVPSVKVLVNLCGVNPEQSIANAVKTTQDLGITTLEPPYGPAIVLGGKEVKLLELTSAYSVFANNGLKYPPISILKILEPNGNVIFENKKTGKRVLSSDTCELISDILSDNKARSPMFGSRSALYFDGFSVSAKTGTTGDYKDAWTIGYTPSMSVGVWVGNNDGTPMEKEPAVVIAGPLFHSFLEKVLSK